MISRNGDITIYHYDADTEEYTGTVYRGVSIYRSTITAFSDRGDGFVNSSSCRIRIETGADIAVSTDDYVFMGIGRGSFDKARCMKVTNFADNRRGSLGHWRIDCV